MGRNQRYILGMVWEAGRNGQWFEEIQEQDIRYKSGRVNSILDTLSLGNMVSEEQRRGVSKSYSHTERDVAWHEYWGPLKGYWRDHKAMGEEGTVAWRGFDLHVVNTGMVVYQITTPIKFPVITTNDPWRATTDLTEQFTVSISFSIFTTANSWSMNWIISIKDDSILNAGYWVKK